MTREEYIAKQNAMKRPRARYLVKLISEEIENTLNHIYYINPYNPGLIAVDMVMAELQDKYPFLIFSSDTDTLLPKIEWKLADN